MILAPRIKYTVKAKRDYQMTYKSTDEHLIPVLED